MALDIGETGTVETRSWKLWGLDGLGIVRRTGFTEEKKQVGPQRPRRVGYFQKRRSNREQTHARFTIKGPRFCINLIN